MGHRLGLLLFRPRIPRPCPRCAAGMFGSGGGMGGPFGGSAGFGGMNGHGGCQQRRPKKDAPHEMELQCSLEELYRGTTRRMKIRCSGCCCCGHGCCSHGLRGTYVSYVCVYVLQRLRSNCPKPKAPNHAARRSARPPPRCLAAARRWTLGGSSGRRLRSWRSTCGRGGRRAPRSRSRRRVREPAACARPAVVVTISCSSPAPLPAHREPLPSRSSCLTLPALRPASPLLPPAGDENPGRIAADIVFVLQERAHPAFRREGNDLVYTHRWGLI